MNLRAGIFGYPLGHSISPAFQQAAFDHLGIDAIYEAWETPPEKLGHAVASLRSGDFMGANVTVNRQSNNISTPSSRWRLP